MRTIINIIKTYPKLILTLAVYAVIGISTIANAQNEIQIDVPIKSNQALIKPLIFIENPNPVHKPTLVFKHGDISWLPELAAQAGWPKDTWPKLGQIILRESGGCPNRYGGSIVDKNCNITGFDGSNHRSDSGLLQINGVHYKGKNSGLCRTMSICSQEPLLNAVTNLKAGKALYDAVGWDPWDPCAWGPKYAKQCAAMDN